MYVYEKLEVMLKQYLNLYRYEHSLKVVKVAIELAKRYNVDIDKAKTAALIHDCAKQIDRNKLISIANENKLNLDEITKTEESLLHGPVGSIIAQRDFGIRDSEILSAIKYHTTGKANMSTLEKIIYLADYIEEGRNFPGVEQLRQKTKINLEEALLMAFDNTLKYIIQKGNLIHPDTIEARNEILRRIYYNKEM